MGIIDRILDPILNAIESFLNPLDTAPADTGIPYTGEPEGAKEGEAPAQIQPIVIQPTDEPTETAPSIAPIETPPIDTAPSTDALQPNTPSQPEPPAPNPADQWTQRLNYGFLRQVHVNDYHLEYNTVLGIYGDGITKDRVLYHADRIERQAKGGNSPLPTERWNQSALTDADTIRRRVQ